jgi:iron complex outermembrane receptor protein
MAYQKQGAGLNLALKPALNRQTDIGLKWQLSATTLAVDLFDVETTDELVVDQAIGGRTSYRNAAQTRRYGSELSWHYRHSAFWRQQLSLTLLQARFLASSQDPLNSLNTRLPGVAREQASWMWQYTPWGDERWQLNGTIHFRGQVFTDDQNRQSAPASTLLNLSSRWQWQQQQWHWQLWMAADNITNQRYVGAVVVNQANGRSFEPGLPRQFQLGVQAIWQP